MSKTPRGDGGEALCCLSKYFLKLNSLVNCEISLFWRGDRSLGSHDRSFRSHSADALFDCYFCYSFPFCPGDSGVQNDSRQFALKRDKCFPTFFISSFVSVFLFLSHFVYFNRTRVDFEPLNKKSTLQNACLFHNCWHLLFLQSTNNEIMSDL